MRVKPLIKAVAGAGMPAVAVTDMSNMCSLVKFYKAAMGAGVKPICGADIWMASAEEDGPLTRLTLLAMNAKGYRNLTELISRGWAEGQSNDLVIIQRDWVKDAAEGLIALSGAREGEVGQALLTGDEALAEMRLREWMAVFPIASIWRCSAPAVLAMRNICTPPWPWPIASRRRWWQPTTCASSSRAISRRTKLASASVKVVPWTTRAGRGITPISSI